MKWTFCLLLFLGSSWTQAQDLRVEQNVGEELRMNPRQLPELRKASGLPQDIPANVLEQDSATLETKKPVGDEGGTVPGLESIREASVYQTVLKSGELTVANVRADRLDNDLKQVSALYRKSGEKATDCMQVALSVKQRIKRAPDTLLAVVDEELEANPGCACEIVKAAIQETDMRVESVLRVVAVAFESSPQNMRLSAQCAIAACPEALSSIQAMLAKYDRGSVTGESAKSAKSAKGEPASIMNEDEVAAIPNPLDFPGGPKGYNTTFHQPPLIIITPDSTTAVDP